MNRIFKEIITNCYDCPNSSLIEPMEVGMSFDYLYCNKLNKKMYDIDEFKHKIYKECPLPYDLEF